ncbi:MAG: hypothetical protein EB003_03845 [Flavobacteriia bacterium]|nr:hypothetical protein [Flavobacteriia bacterium]
MSRLVLVFALFIALNAHVWSAPLMSHSDRLEIQQIQSELLRSNGAVSKELQSKHPIYNLDGRWYLSMLGRCNAAFKPEELQWQRILFQKPIAGLLSLKVPLQKLAALSSLKGLDYLEIAGRIIPNLDKAIIDLHADSVHAGIGLPQGYAGKDVFIGVTDWGFDYTHPVFYDTLLQQHLIMALNTPIRLAYLLPVAIPPISTITEPMAHTSQALPVVLEPRVRTVVWPMKHNFYLLLFSWTKALF